MGTLENTYSRMVSDGGYDALTDQEFLEAYAAAARLLGACFAYSPKDPVAARALDAIRAMDVRCDWPFGAADEGGANAGLLAQAADCIAQGAAEGAGALAGEYQRLFVGPGHLAVPPWGSVYMDRDKVMYGCSWVELRAWMHENGVVAEYAERVPEDQIGRELVLSAEVAACKPAVLPELLGDHIMPWAGHYFDLLAGEARLATYKGLAMLAKATLADVQQLLGVIAARKRLYI